LKKLKIVTFPSYRDFVKASADDLKIEVLSEANNTYRTLSALSIAVLLTKAFENAANKWTWISDGTPWLILVGLLVLFIYAYRKQSTFIRKRIEHAVNQEKD
jgi:hypothetical protein